MRIVVVVCDLVIFAGFVFVWWKLWERFVTRPIERLLLRRIKAAEDRLRDAGTRK